MQGAPVITASDAVVACECQQNEVNSDDDEDFVACDTCDRWSHTRCVDWVDRTGEFADIKWQCKQCRGTHSVFVCEMIILIPRQTTKQNTMITSNSDGCVESVLD